VKELKDDFRRVLSSITDRTVEINDQIKSQIGGVKVLVKNVHQKLVEEIGDLETLLDSRLDNVDASISEISSAMQSSFLHLNIKMKNLKDWTTLVSTYS